MKKSTKNFICIHGHFYQPPRENPWTNTIDPQLSADPFHDWNERITEECYRANANSKIIQSLVKESGAINNYAHMSFNFGPTLLSWLEAKAQDVYADILQADKLSQQQFSGHGAAIAQTYNHMIMPLADKRDKRTQVYWGLRDFEYRFKRKPEGMWLSETAVDIDSLECMADEGIKFTILAPHQARQVKRKWGFIWHNLKHKPINTQRPYLCRLPSGKTITIFFYDGAISADVAFGGLLHDGEKFFHRLIGAFSSQSKPSRLVHIATDGETYGHHHKFGDMALGYVLEKAHKDPGVALTVYGEFLKNNPPNMEVRIVENSSWSCEHGVERWRSNCGCRIDTSVPPHQEWRKYVRDALDWLREQLIKIYAEGTKEYFEDPWLVRDESIDIFLKPDEILIAEFFHKYSRKPLTQEEQDMLYAYIEMQRLSMLMYTSCGWFFDDVARIETIQILRYAARAIEIAEGLSEIKLEDKFLERLKEAKSSDPQYQDASQIFQHVVKPAKDKNES